MVSINPSEEYARQIGTFPQVGMNIKKYVKPPPIASIIGYGCPPSQDSRWQNAGFLFGGGASTKKPSRNPGFWLLLGGGGQPKWLEEPGMEMGKATKN